MAVAKQRRFDAVLVWKLDRFARSVRHLVNALAELEALGVAFVSLKDNVSSCKNAAGTGRGVRAVTVVPDGEIPLVDDGNAHQVRVEPG